MLTQPNAKEWQTWIWSTAKQSPVTLDLNDAMRLALIDAIDHRITALDPIEQEQTAFIADETKAAMSREMVENQLLVVRDGLLSLRNIKAQLQAQKPA